MLLGIQNVPREVSSLEEDEKLIYEIRISGQMRKANFISESGLYAKKTGFRVVMVFSFKARLLAGLGLGLNSRFERFKRLKKLVNIYVLIVNV